MLKVLSKRCHEAARSLKNPVFIRVSGVFGIIPTRKMKLNSKRFCLGDLMPFDFS